MDSKIIITAIIVVILIIVLVSKLLASKKNKGQPATNNMQNLQNNSNSTVTLPNGNNGIDYNSSNTQTPFMFDQNINTEINPIPGSNVNNNLNSQVNPMSQPEMSQTPVFNPTAPLVNPQPESNVVSNNMEPVQSVNNLPTNSIDNQVNQVQGVVPPQVNTFKYETPIQVAESQTAVTSQQEPTMQNGFVTGNQNTEPVSPQPQVNVIPGMGTLPQPETPNQNVGNNQSNQTM